jgi:capsular exopolysaccharide synthesis family protein
MPDLANQSALRARDGDDEAASPLDVHLALTALRCWWKLVVPLSVLLALVAAVAVFFLASPRYTASVWLIIREKPEYLLSPHVMEDPRKFVLNQMELMRSPPVIDPVGNKPEVASTPELAGADPAERLRRLLKVQSKGQSDFFVIEFTSKDPAKAALIVNEVAKAYLHLQYNDQSERMEATIRQLDKQRTEQQQAIEHLRSMVRETTKTLTGIDPFASKLEGGKVAAVHDPLSSLREQIVAAEIDYAMTAAQVEAEEELLTKQVVEVPASEVESQVQALPEIVALRRRIAGAQPILHEHERTSTNLQRNYGYQTLVRQKAADEERLRKRLEELRLEVKAELERTTRTRQSDQLSNMRKSLEAKRLSAQILRERLEKEKGAQQVYKGETVELEFLRADYESAAKVFEAINERMVAMRMEQHAPERVRLIKEAEQPTFPDHMPSYKRMGVASLAALSVPFGLALAFELLHRRVSSRQQLESRGLMPVVAEVTALPRMKPSQRIAGAANRELQLFEECIDSLRIQLLLGDKHVQTIAVTSAISREGKTSVAVQLALSLARATGEPTLLIDGDTRCPDIHRIFGVERSPGLVEALAGDCPLEEAIETGFRPSFHIMTAGTLACAPHRLFGTDAFPRLIETVRAQYRHIILDTPPILPASEALLIARAADAAVVCARRDHSRLHQVSEAYARLRGARINVVGTVLNGISARSYTYRYGSYHYPTLPPTSTPGGGPAETAFTAE